MKFVVITRLRTGSNLRVNLLGSHPDIATYGEMFNQLHGLTSEWIWNSIFGFKSRSVKFVGFKIFYYHPLNSDDRWIWDKIYSDNTIPVIHLVRDNTLQTFLSKQIADKTKVWQNQNGKNFFDDESKRVYLNPKKCLEVFERTERWVNDTDQKLANHRTIKISYEEITGDKQSDTLEKIQPFLGVSPMALSSGMRKQNNENEAVADLIENYSEIESALTGTRWEKFLYWTEVNRIEVKYCTYQLIWAKSDFKTVGV